MHSNIPMQLISIINFILLLLPSAFFTTLIAKPRCPDRCGDLSIPYPFGVGSSCSLDPSFTISCNTSTNPPKAYLTIIDKEVIEINQNYVRVKYPNYLASTCYQGSGINATAKPVSYSTAFDLSGTQYTLSEENWLTAIGCDDMVLGIEHDDGSLVGGGCASVCADRKDAGAVVTCPDNGNWSMLGNGCCRARISAGTTFLRAELTDLSRKLSRSRIFPCSYAFIQETGSSNQLGFSYPLNFLKAKFPNYEFKKTITPPVVRLDWRIGAENCSQAILRDDDGYQCRDNSVCVDLVSHGAGYRCSCLQGYEGNPYLIGGCRALSHSIAKPGCLNQCGNLSIPFPFGVGKSCYMKRSFEISCNFSTNPPKPYLSALNAEIIELNPSQIWVKYPNLATTCYNLSEYGHGNISKIEDRGTIIDLSGTPYTLSTKNWLTVIGCDDMGVGFGEANRSFVHGGCASFCPDKNDSGDRGYCPYDTYGYRHGFGCCRAPISKGTTYLEAKLTDLSPQYRRRKLFSCSYALLGEKSQYFSYPLNYLNNSMAITPDDPKLPDSLRWPVLVLDWRIEEASCHKAQRNLATFACLDNSDCVDFDANVGGYLCKCSKGYEGNAYLKPGCQDINECDDNKINPCDSKAICINIPGSVICSCPKGHHGDGRKDGRGCIQLSRFKSKHIIFIVVGCGLGFVPLQPFSFWLYKILKKRKGKKCKEELFKRLLLQHTNEATFRRTKLFPAKELEKATDHFNESRILGRGGQGIVYKGMLNDGTFVAIKRLKQVDEAQVEQFINEVVILSQINHRNIVKLFGCCLATEVPLLVYEFVQNGTLFDLIHDSNIEFPVTWNMRLKIATDVAGAVAYLHSACSIPVYHRDIKSSNFLLDEKYVVKVADFGISRFVGVDKTHLTTMVKGTFGYFDPEYFESHQYTEKSDVFSFGVVLAELITGKRPIFRERYGGMARSLSAHFLTSMKENRLKFILDPEISEHIRRDEVIALAKLAQRCLSRKRKNRPTMKEVSMELEILRISQIPATVKEEESEDERVYEANPKMISDIQYAWTTGCTSEPSKTSSNMFETV